MPLSPVSRGRGEDCLSSSGFPARDLPAATGLPGDCRCGAVLRAVGLTRRREAAKENAELSAAGKGDLPPHPRPLSSVSRGRGEDCLSSSGFPARDLPLATRLPGVCRCRAGGLGEGWSHTKPRKKTQTGEVTGVMSCPALLTTFSSLCSMAWTPCPLTPDPSPPFHGGEGRINGQGGADGRKGAQKIRLRLEFQ